MSGIVLCGIALFGTFIIARRSFVNGILSVLSTAPRPAYKATVGYDLATGLGSVNAYNLAVNWPK